MTLGSWTSTRSTGTRRQRVRRPPVLPEQRDRSRGRLEQRGALYFHLMGHPRQRRAPSLAAPERGGTRARIAVFAVSSLPVGQEESDRRKREEGDRQEEGSDGDEEGTPETLLVSLLPYSCLPRSPFPLFLLFRQRQAFTNLGLDLLDEPFPLLG